MKKSPHYVPVIGIIGGGQLARMLLPPAIELGLSVKILAESPDACVVPVAAEVQIGDYRDLETLREFAASVDVITFDHEHVPSEHLATLTAEGHCLRPGADALLHAQDKILMRQATARLGLPNPPWRVVTTHEEILDFTDEHGWPVVLKTPRGGYDGKGVAFLNNPADVDTAKEWFQDQDQLLLEAGINFHRELAVLIARNPQGETAVWPVVESIQVDGVCDEVIAPAPRLESGLAQTIQNTAIRLAEELQVTGVMAVELFETSESPTGFYLNELAMRPHNSGHWTMDGAVTGQFEQHLRAVASLPLGDCTAQTVTVMKNILGGENTDLFRDYATALAHDPRIKLHNYGKAPRVGRKLGHLNALAHPGGLALPEESVESLRKRTQELARILRNSNLPSHQGEV